MKLRAFISYSIKDKETVGELVEYLEALGLEVFAAHDKLEISHQFEQIIASKVRECDVFIALITPRFHLSEWTDQECGMALAYDKLFVPIVYRTKSYGFLKKFNYKPLASDLRETVADICKALASEKKFKRTLRNYLAKQLIDAPNFDTAIVATNVIEEIRVFTKTETACIINATLHNDQIWKCGTALNNMQSFYRRNRHLVDSKLRAEYEKNFPDWKG